MKRLLKSDEFIFDPSNSRIVFNFNINYEQILFIYNMSNKVEIFDGEEKGGNLSNNILTLEYDVSSMLQSDILQIWIWDYKSVGNEVSLKYDDNYLYINKDGSLNIKNIIKVPEGSITFILSEKKSLSRGVYTKKININNGDKLVINRFFGTVEGNDGRFLFQLFYSENGLLDNNSVLLSCYYIISGFFDEMLDIEYEGNGIRCLYVYVEKIDSVSRNIFYKVQGYINWCIKNIFILYKVVGGFIYAFK